MEDEKTESLWEHIESYDAGDGFWGNVKSYTVFGLYLGFFFVFIPLCISIPLARGLGLDGLGYLLFIPVVGVIWYAGKSIRFPPRNK